MAKSEGHSQASSPPVALITGAGSGIGRATALELARHGWSLALLGRSAERLASAATECARGGSPKVEHLSLDLGKPESADRATSLVESRFGRLDALVNNAGVGERRPIPSTTAELLEEVFAVNTFAPALLIARAWALFERTRANHPLAPAPAIINISSMATIDPFPGLFVYAASKAALESFARSIRNEAGESAVRAFAIAPGAVETPLLRSAFDEQMVPRSRTLPPEAIARVVVECVLGLRDGEAGGTIFVPSS